MTNEDIAEHNATAAELTAEDGIPRLMWEQHRAAFEQPAPTSFDVGQQVAAWDSSTPGTVGVLRDGQYDVTFPDLGKDHRPCRYPASQLRPWPEQIRAANRGMR